MMQTRGHRQTPNRRQILFQDWLPVRGSRCVGTSRTPHPEDAQAHSDAIEIRWYMGPGAGWEQVKLRSAEHDLDHVGCDWLGSTPVIQETDHQLPSSIRTERLTHAVPGGHQNEDMDRLLRPASASHVRAKQERSPRTSTRGTLCVSTPSAT